MDTVKIGWLGVINVGVFFVFYAFAILIRANYKERVLFNGKKIVWLCIIFVELICCAYICTITIFRNYAEESNWLTSVGLITLSGLAFCHGLTSSHFITKNPKLSEIPHSKQAHAY